MKKKKLKRNNSSKVGHKKRTSNCNSNLSFEKNSGIITDNEYEISSELSNYSSKKKNNKKRCK